MEEKTCGKKSCIDTNNIMPYNPDRIIKDATHTRITEGVFSGDIDIKCPECKIQLSYKYRNEGLGLGHICYIFQCSICGRLFEFMEEFLILNDTRNKQKEIEEQKQELPSTRTRIGSWQGDSKLIVKKPDKKNSMEVVLERYSKLPDIREVYNPDPSKEFKSLGRRLKLWK